MIKLTRTLILPNCQVPNVFFLYNCKFYHSKIEKYTFSLSQFSLVTGFFEGTRGNIFQIFWAIFNVQAQKFRKLDNLFWHFFYHRMQLGIKVSRTSSSFDVTYCPTRFSKVVQYSCVLDHALHCKYIDCQKHNFSWFNISHALQVPCGHLITGPSTADKWYFHLYFWKYFLYHTNPLLICT